MYSDAQALVEGFNNFYKTDRPIDVTLMQCIQQHSNDPNMENISSLKIILRENISSGAATVDIGMRRILMPAFMHLSWIHTKGQNMVGDLQGNVL